MQTTVQQQEASFCCRRKQVSRTQPRAAESARRPFAAAAFSQRGTARSKRRFLRFGRKSVLGCSLFQHIKNAQCAWSCRLPRRTRSSVIKRSVRFMIQRSVWCACTVSVTALTCLISKGMDGLKNQGQGQARDPFDIFRCDGVGF